MTKPQQQIATELTSARAKLKSLEKKLTTAEVNAARILKDMAALEAQGFQPGSLFFKANQYAYIVSPMIQGERTREYIGADDEKIRQAKARLDRYTWYTAKQQELEAIQKHLANINFHLTYID